MFRNMIGEKLLRSLLLSLAVSQAQRRPVVSVVSLIALGYTVLRPRRSGTPSGTDSNLALRGILDQYQQLPRWLWN